MVRRSGYITLALFAVASVGATARAETPPPADAPPADAPPADAPPAPEPPAVVAPGAEAKPADMPPPPPPPAVPAPHKFSPLKIESNGSSIRLGLLLQPQFQAASSATLSGYSENMFLRRTRVLIGGTVLGAFDYFLETDYPNLFLSSNVAGDPNATPPTMNRQVKAAPGMNIQDAFITYKGLGDVFKVDAGYMLPPMEHNALQGAGTLLSWDYYSFAFRHSDAFGASSSPVGRDVGVQVRGLVLNGMLEYRAGLFQGLRDAQTSSDVGSRNFFRATGRVQVNLLDAESGFFYAGTYLGAKKILSFGLSGDLQDTYKYFGADGFLDMPMGPGVLTAQVDFAHWDGGTYVTALPKQWALMGEAGYTFAGLLGVIGRGERLVISGSPDTTINRLGGGLALWAYGHNSNVKLFYTNIKESGAKAVNQINLQWQLYFF